MKRFFVPSRSKNLGSERRVGKTKESAAEDLIYQIYAAKEISLLAHTTRGLRDDYLLSENSKEEALYHLLRPAVLLLL